MTADRLYGLPDSDHLHGDPAACYEADIKPWVDEHDQRPRQIEEWTVRTPGFGLPDADTILGWMVEHLADSEEGWEDADYERLERLPDLLAAAEVFRVTVAKQITWRMADERVAVHTVTFDAEGEPLLDGEPMYRKRADA